MPDSNDPALMYPDDDTKKAWANMFSGSGQPSAPVGTMYALGAGDNGGGVLQSNLPGGQPLDPNGSGPLAVRGNAGWYDRDGNMIGAYGAGGGLPWGIGPGGVDLNGAIGPTSPGAPLQGASGLPALLQALQSRQTALYPDYKAPTAQSAAEARAAILKGLLD